MQENSKKILFDTIDNASELGSVLKYMFLCDRALGYAVQEGLFDLKEDEISGMNYLKDIALDKYIALQESLDLLHESTK